MASVRGFRTTTAYVVWGVCALFALALAGAALLVGLKADPSHAMWGPWLSMADVVTVGWFARPEPGALAAAQDGSTVIRCGSAALAAVGVGVLVQGIVRPRRPQV